jgi:hypothetical protein
VRYAFHGKVRGTGHVVDGYVEANNSAEAIDRLADQGIIGVHTVRPDPLPVRNAIQLAGPNGQPGVGAENGNMPALPLLAPEQVLTQLVEKLSSLVGQVEGILSRPMNFSGGGAAPVRGSRSARSMHPSTEQNAVLKAIFQTNVDLRKSLMKLADVSKSLQPQAAAEAPKNGEEQELARPAAAAAPAHHEVDPAVLHDEEPPARNVIMSHSGNGREVVSVHNGAPIDEPMHANPAA